MVGASDVVYAYSLADLALDIGAVYYAYRLTKITGAFTGWVLMVAVVVLITVQSASSILTVALLRPDLNSTVFSGGAIIPTAAIGIALSLAAFGAMFELFRTFSRLEGGRPAEQ